MSKYEVSNENARKNVVFIKICFNNSTKYSIILTIHYQNK